LVEIKCLDEGLDVPATKNAIILASTSNPREYIQRRGRILRRFPGKEYAILYDFFVEPSSIMKYRDVDQSVFNTEYKRFKEFADLSINRDENYQLMQQLIVKNNLKVN
jgi:superfamily II DNA or RNA helicase